MPRARVVRALFVLAATVPILACGFGDRLAQTAFESVCVTECVPNADRPNCESYCGCAFRWAKESGRMPELERAQHYDGTGPMPPVLVDVMVACGSDLYDAAFQRSCVEGCAVEADRAVCETDCACILRELRGSGPRDESTRFLMENMTDPPTPAGQARLQAAEAACTSIE
ncbi:MAG TPA: hypothetical protein VIL20_12120 [Sandaracinaceae bacterium]